MKAGKLLTTFMQVKFRIVKEPRVEGGRGGEGWL
jgi:hypothetical protein